MAQTDSAIQDLTLASEINSDDRFVIEQSGEAKCLKGETLKAYAQNVVAKIYSGASPADTDNVWYNPSTNVISFRGTDGEWRGITSISFAGASISGLVKKSGTGAAGTYDVYHVLLDNGNELDTDIKIYNGLDGTGTVNTVNSVSPDSNHNVALPGSAIPINANTTRTMDFCADPLTNASTEVVCIGDSYLRGESDTSTEESTANWMTDMINIVGADSTHWHKYALGGVGFVTANGLTTFKTLIQDASNELTEAQRNATALILFGGGYNDRTQSTSDIVSAMQEIKEDIIDEYFPNARVAVLCLGATYTMAAETRNEIETAYAAGALECGWECYNYGIEPCMVNVSSYMGPYLIHPTAAGYKEMAKGIVAFLRHAQTNANNMVEDFTDRVTFDGYVSKHDATFIRVGNMVWFNYTSNMVTHSMYEVLASIPEGYRPKNQMFFAGSLCGPNNYGAAFSIAGENDDNAGNFYLNNPYAFDGNTYYAFVTGFYPLF